MESSSKQQEVQNIYNLLNLQIIKIVKKNLEKVEETPISDVVDLTTNQTRQKTPKKNKVTSVIKVKSTVQIDDNDLKDIKELINYFNKKYINTIKVLSNHLEHLILENIFISSDFYKDLKEGGLGEVDLNILMNKQKKASLIYKNIIAKLKKGKKIQMFPRNEIQIDDDDKNILNEIMEYYIHNRPIIKNTLQNEGLEHKYRNIINTTTELPIIDGNNKLRDLHETVRCNVYNNINGKKCCDKNCCRTANELHTLITGDDKNDYLSAIDSINMSEGKRLYTKYFVESYSCPSTSGGKRRRTRRKQRKTKRVKRKNTRRKRRRN